MSDVISEFPSDNPETTVWELLQQIDIDPLTGFGNRKKGEEMLGKYINRTKENGKKLGVVFLDLDKFKPINEEYDHEVGDTVLSDVSRALRDSFRPGDIPIRYGGDEFYVICPGMDEEPREEIEKRVKNKIQTALSKRDDYDKKPELSDIGATVHYVFWNGSETPREMISRVDKMMNDIKRRKHKEGYDKIT